MTSSLLQQDTRPPAPLGGDSDRQRRCMRLLGHDATGGEILCGAPAVTHVIYRWEDAPPGGNPGDYWDHGFACAEHWADYQARWSCAAAHGVGDACGMPGSIYVHEHNLCVFDELPTAEPVRAIATEVLA